ncbi:MULTISPECIES: hypothetical protein [Lachnospiraceae]|nr:MULTISPECIES: hypothetical protein [Clostridia]GKH32170.1 hypothetical protein CE91St64_15770 [Faecalicatena contorta]
MQKDVQNKETAQRQEHGAVNENASGMHAKRTYKSRLFEMIFSEKRALLDLYNAMNGTEYNDPELLEINTLENAIYMSMKNDLSFIIDSRLTLYEHQSTFSPNLPLRCLMYVSDLYSVMTRDENLYGTKTIQIPTPRFVIFYNGTEKMEDIKVLRLSDAFTVPEQEYALELTAVMLNINPGHNTKLLDTCKTLKDYSEYVSRVREYAGSMGLEAAVELAITECIRENILSEFLSKNRAEVKSVSIYEYDEEKHMRQVKEEGFQEGHQRGIEEGRQKGLQEGHEKGVQEGHEKGVQEGIQVLIEFCREVKFSREKTKAKAAEKFSLEPAEAEKYMEKFW